MRRIKSIMCCCGNGLGSSLIVRLNIENVLEDHHIKDITITHSSISEITPYSADLFVVGLDVAKVLRGYPRVVVIKDLISYEEMEEKLLKALNTDEKKFYIE